MKKIFIVIASVIMLCFMMDMSRLQAQEHEIPSGEFYPIGINYIDPYYIIHTAEGNLATFSRIQLMKTKANTKYAFILYREIYHIGNDSFVLDEYDENKVHIKKTNYYFSSDPNRIEFHTSPTTAYIKFSLDYEIYGEIPSGFYEMDRYYLLCESSLVPLDYNQESVRYLGPKINYQVIGFNETLDYQINVDQPLSFETLKKAIKAFDNYDGDITKNMKIVKNEYQNNENKLGTYIIEFEVEDKGKNQSKLKFRIVVYDDTAPIISGNKELKTNPVNVIDINSMKSSMTAIDNYDGNISQHITVLRDEYTPNKHKLGKYKIEFGVQDSSGNQSIFETMIIVEDKVKPVATGKGSYTIGVNEVLTMDTILSNIRITDDIDGELVPKVMSEDYSIHMHKIGEWYVEIGAYDKAGNYGHVTVRITIKDDIPPIFMIDIGTIHISNQVSQISVEKMIEIMKDSFPHPLGEQYQVIQNTYEDSNQVSGTYEILLSNGETNYKLNIEVIAEEKKEPVTDSKDSTWINKITMFFRKIGSFFKRTWKSLF